MGGNIERSCLLYRTTSGASILRIPRHDLIWIVSVEQQLVQCCTVETSIGMAGFALVQD